MGPSSLRALGVEIFGEVPGEDFNRIFIRFPGKRSWSPLIGGYWGRAAGPDVSGGFPCLVLLLFWVWS